MPLPVLVAVFFCFFGAAFMVKLCPPLRAGQTSTPFYPAKTQRHGRRVFSFANTAG